MRLVTTFIQNTESTDPDLSYLNRARFVLSVADGHGSDGVGILDAVIRNRHLFLSMTSGAEIDAGSVFTEDDLPVASDSRLGIAAFDPAYFSILAGKVSLRGDLDFGLNETQLAEYLTANKYATQAWVAAQGFIGSDGLALYATKEWVLGQNFAKASSLGNYLLKSVWDEVFEVTTVNGVRVLNVKLDIAGLKGISAYGLGSTSGGGASGSLGELVNVGKWADEVPTADRVMVQLAGATHWSAKPLADLVGLDTAALAQYLTANSYLKASDISSYLTWANLSGKPTVYPTSWANIADKPTVYPTTWTSVTGRPTKLSQFTDDVVAGNYLPKPTWDAAFEVVTVDGTPALKVKYDILGLKGITAYSDGSLSGGFSGALVDLVDVAVTNLASGDILKYNGTHFVNVPVSSIAGASSWDQITGKPEYYPTRWADVSGAPTSLPASDVYPWAKAASKPTYTAAEVGALALSGGSLTGNVITIGSFILANSGAYPQLTFRSTADNSERLLFRHGNDLKWRYNGTNDGIIYHSGNFNPSSKLDKSVWDEAFELKTVNGVRVISAKLDFLSVAGISAYATGPSSGGGGGGLDYDLLKQALTGAITPDGYPFTISASFLGAIDKTYLTGKLANTYANKVHTHLWADIPDRPTALPANGGNAESAIKDGNGNVIANTYLPLSGGSITGDLGVSGYLTAGSLKINETGNVYPLILFTGNNGNSSLLFVNAISRELVFRPTNGVLNDGIVYHSKNLTKLSQLTNDVVPSWALATTNYHLPYDDTRSTNYAPYNSNIPKGLTTVHMKATGIDGLADGGNFHSSIYITPWVDASGGHAHNIAFTDNGNMWMRHGTASWSEWVKVYHSGNFNPNDKFGFSAAQLSDLNNAPNNAFFVGASNAANAPVAGSWSNGFTIAYGNNPDFRKQFVSAGDKWWTRGRDGVNWGTWRQIWDSGNSNLSTVDWAAKNITAAGTVTAPTFVGNLSGSADKLFARYTGDGGQQGPGYFGKERFGCLMMNTPVNGNSHYKNWLICDAYSGSDAGGATAIGVDRHDMRVFAMSSDANRTSWNRSCELYTTVNANLSTVNWTANTLTTTKLVIGGITIDVYNGALRVNGNLVATGGVTAYQ